MKYDVQVIGLGYVGLPLAVCASQMMRVHGVDLDQNRLREIRSKTAIVEDSTVADLFKTCQFDVAASLVSSSVHVVCVPTPVDAFKRPDLRPVLAAVEALMLVVEDNDLLVIESTIYPGLCEEEILPILVKANKNIYLAHCPERINPGDSEYGVKNIPRVVGATCNQGLVKASSFYRKIIDAEINELNSIRNAEATKILENIFRDVNIALVNEMAQAFHRMEIDIIEVLKGASSKPFAFLPHFPGVGVGGHCIAVDPYYMIEKGNAAGFDHEFLRLARKINEGMPTYTVNLLQNTLNKVGIAISSARVGVYGLSYKPDVSDDRESPSFHVIDKLKLQKHSEVLIYDPYIKSKSTHSTLEDFLRNCDCIVICTAHREIQDVDWKNFHNIKVILDGRNCITKDRLLGSASMYQGIGHN